MASLLIHNDHEEQRLRRKAKLEIGEREEDIPTKIRELKELIAKQDGDDKFHMHPSPTYDDFYLKCLRARKYDLERAAKLYKKYCHTRTHALSMVPKLYGTCHQRLYEDKLCSIMKSRDDKGRQVFIVRIEKWDPSQTSFEDFLCSLFLLLDEVLNSVDTQLHGITVIGDLKGLGVSHVRLVSPSKLRIVAGVLQDSYPARFKEFHVFNNPYVFNMVWTLLKPFLKEKIRKRIHFHGTDLAGFHKSVSMDKDQLPDFLGGAVGEEEYADLSVIKSLLGKDEYFKDFFKYGYASKS